VHENPAHMQCRVLAPLKAPRLFFTSVMYFLLTAYIFGWVLVLGN